MKKIVKSCIIMMLIIVAFIFACFVVREITGSNNIVTSFIDQTEAVAVTLR